MIRNILIGLKTIFTSGWILKRIIPLTILIFTLNIYIPIAIPWILSGSAPNKIDFNGALAKGNNKINYLILFQTPYKLTSNLGENLSGETYLYIIYTLNDVIIYIIISILASTAILSTLYYAKISKNKCMLEKSGVAAGSAATLIGISTLTSSIISCPSCGFSMAATIAAIGVATATGSTLGVSKTLINIFYYSSIIGLVVNLAIILYIAMKIGSLIK